MHTHNTHAIVGGKVLTSEGQFEEATVLIEHGNIVDITGDSVPEGFKVIDAKKSWVLPGMVDVHGDSFERQIMPRAGVQVDTGIALIDSDRQMLANGITTAFHGVTYSWEPGLRGRDTLHKIRHSLDHLKDRLCVDTRLHMRFETFNLKAENEIIDWLGSGAIDLLAFNDHTGLMVTDRNDTKKVQRVLDRTGLKKDEYLALLDSVYEQAAEVDPLIERLANAGKMHNVPMFSHDDDSPNVRTHYNDLGCHTSEFPLNMETAMAAADLGNEVVVGAPNVIRGGSHIGGTSAAELITEGSGSVIASDYYYPALWYAAFTLTQQDLLNFPDAWALVSKNPARATGLCDRGEIAVNMRADLLVLDQFETKYPRLKLAMVQGKTTAFH